MTSRIGAIAANTFREAVRDRVLYNLVIFALLLIGASLVFGQISIDIERIVLVNLGLTAMSLFGVVIGAFIGVGLVSKEIEKRTLYTVLTRPVRRWEFIVGKFAGLVATLTVNALFMSLGFFVALLVIEGANFTDASSGLLAAIYFILWQFVLVTAVAMLFSSFSTPLFSIIFALALFVAGTFGGDLRLLSTTTHGFTKVVVTVAAYLVPNFSAFNVISAVAHKQPVPGNLILLNTVYGICYACVVLAGATLIFERRNLK